MHAGKRTKEWQRLREQLKPRFAAVGITHCEFKYKGCWYDNGLGFAHLRKRANLRDGELRVVALACNICHDMLELLPEEEMARTVQRAITNRVLQPDLTGIT